MDRKIIAITGLAKAGKSVVTTYIAEHYGYHTITPSVTLHQELVAESGNHLFSREQYMLKSNEMRAKYGPLYYVNRPDFDVLDKIVICGPRHKDSVNAIYRMGGFAIGLVARPEVRFARSLENGDKLPNDNLEAFLKSESTELNDITGRGGQILPILWGISPEDIIDTSDQTHDETYQNVDEIMARHFLHPAS